MKATKSIAIISAALAAAALLSCSRQEPASQTAADGFGSLTLRVVTGDVQTKASANTNESTLTDVQVFVFNTADELYRYYTLKSEEMSSKTCTIPNMKIGTYSMHIVANGPDMSASVHNKSELLATSIELGAYNAAANDFVMAGYKDGIVVTADQVTNVTVDISRFVSRVTISQIKNNLPEAFGDMTVNYAVLSNVVGNQKINGADPAATWYNKDGRADETARDASHIIGIGTYKASAEHDTYTSYAQVVTNGNSITDKKFFYAYPNSLTARGTGYTSPYSPKATCLDLSISFTVGTTAHTYWYNVPLQGTVANPGILRNYDYDVKITISGEGADEPGKYTEKGSIKATITINDWTDGTSTSIDI